ncbi:hypothetical protein GCM10023338_06430 [Wohlfahrtiimonas larvae]|uniref:Uncharacterized protein n=1 Tax=Wohlfahrtiimonas larvae TaxID=1157986 RepID=A0ABP9MIE5_9GAMM
MIIGFGMQFLSTKDSVAEVESSEQLSNYIDEVTKCQTQADNK